MVNWPVVFRALGIMLSVFSLVNLPPILIAKIFNEVEIYLFIFISIICSACGVLLWFPFRTYKNPLKARDGFIITVLFWVLLGSFGALPFIFMDRPALSLTDAIFEDFSGLTTTGATIIEHIESLPRSILFYRQQLQWLGGMGIVVLAVAVLPSLGAGSIRLYRTEVPGPVKDHKITPRVAETAKALWIIYSGMTVVCAILYYIAGMDWFDSICHSFSTVAIGGFSTHDESITYFHNLLVDDIAVAFMLISGINFSLHYLSWHRGSWSHYIRDPEFSGYIRFIVAGVICTSFILYFTRTYDFSQSIQYGAFEFISTATTTGFSITGFSSWPLLLTQILILSSFIGCCSGSAGGGIKVIRVLLIFKQGYQELKKLTHPDGVFTLKLGGLPVPQSLASTVLAFLSMYIFLFSILYIALLSTGLDIITAFSSLASCMNNLGPALGQASANYSSLPDAAKWILTFAMLLGRLEVFTLLIIFTPVFWKQ